MFTDDPIADFNRYDAKQERAMQRYPKCACCGKRITDDYLFYIEGNTICEVCVEDEYKRNTDDFID